MSLRKTQLWTIALMLFCGCITGRQTRTRAICLPHAVAPEFLQQFQSNVVVSPFGDGTNWWLQLPLRWKSAQQELVLVPKGFVTDFASIPSFVWPVLPRWHRYGPAAVVHDYLYASQHVSRATADAYLKEGMHDMRVPGWQKTVIYGFVRLFGGFAWNQHAKHPNEVVCITDDFPNEPRETWDEWKRAHSELNGREHR